MWRLILYGKGSESMKRNRLYVLGCGLLLTVSCIGAGAAGELVYAGVQEPVQLEAPAIVDTMTGVEEQNLDSGEGERNTLGRRHPQWNSRGKQRKF